MAEVGCYCGSIWGRYEKGTVTLKAGNALDDPALDEYGPFSAIHVGAAASDLPQVQMMHQSLTKEWPGLGNQNGIRDRPFLFQAHSCGNFTGPHRQAEARWTHGHSSW